MLVNVIREHEIGRTKIVMTDVYCDGTAHRNIQVYEVFTDGFLKYKKGQVFDQDHFERAKEEYEWLLRELEQAYSKNLRAV